MRIPENIVLRDVDIAQESFANKAIAVHLHLFYPDMADMFAQHLSRIPVAFDLLLSIPQTVQCDTSAVEAIFRRLPLMGQLITERTPNRGRDIAPMLCSFAERLCQYDIVLHLHSKKSPHNSNYEGWNVFIMEHLMGSQNNVKRILTLLCTSHGIIAPPDFIRYRGMGGWLSKSNLRYAQKVMDRTNCHINLQRDCPEVYFPQGSMFWARTSWLAPLLQMKLRYKDFPKEPIASDGTIAHAIERLFFLWGEGSGLGTAYVYNHNWEVGFVQFFDIIESKNRRHLRTCQRLIWALVAMLLVIITLVTYIILS